MKLVSLQAWLAGECSTPRSMVVAEADEILSQSFWRYTIKKLARKLASFLPLPHVFSGMWLCNVIGRSTLSFVLRGNQTDSNMYCTTSGLNACDGMAQT